jgi:hypothetical protein
LEHDFFDFPYIGNKVNNWLSYFSERLKPPTRYIYIYIAEKKNGISNFAMFGQFDTLKSRICGAMWLYQRSIFGFQALRQPWFS